MFHSCKLNNRINKIHERSLRIVYRDNCSSFEELLCKDNSFTVHERNIQYLAIELFKLKNAIAPEFMNDIFPLKNKLLYCYDFLITQVYCIYNGTETLSHLGPNEIKASITII